MTALGTRLSLDDETWLQPIADDQALGPDAEYVIALIERYVAFADGEVARTGVEPGDELELYESMVRITPEDLDCARQKRARSVTPGLAGSCGMSLILRCGTFASALCRSPTRRRASSATLDDAGARVLALSLRPRGGPRSRARRLAATAARAMYCLRCGRPTTDFVQIDPLEVPPGVTLGPCVMPEMDEPGRGSYDKDSRR